MAAEDGQGVPYEVADVGSVEDGECQPIFEAETSCFRHCKNESRMGAWQTSFAART
jgi:hypothetical protein